MAWCFATLGIKRRPIVRKWRGLPPTTVMPYRAKNALTYCSSVNVLGVQGSNSTPPTPASVRFGIEFLTATRWAGGVTSFRLHMPMFFFQFEVRPNQSHPKRTEYGGGMVNCWVMRDTQAQAAAVAREWIDNEQWQVTSVEEARLITRECQAESPDGLKYFEQAVIDSEVFVFHTWPLNMSSQPAEIEIDLGGIETSARLHEILASHLGFPDYYGKSWDAFWDCIRDPEQSRMPEVLRLRGWSKLETRLPVDAKILKMQLADFPLERPECQIVWD